MNSVEIVCWVRSATLCSPPFFETLNASHEHLVEQLNAIMDRSGSSLLSCPASFLCCGFLCSQMRNNQALRQVDLFLQHTENGRFALVFKTEDLAFGPDAWVVETKTSSLISSSMPPILLYQQQG